MNMIRAYVLAGLVASPNRVPVITKTSVKGLPPVLLAP